MSGFPLAVECYDKRNSRSGGYMHVVCNFVLSKLMLALEHRRQKSAGKADTFMPRYLESTSRQSTAAKTLSARS